MAIEFKDVVINVSNSKDDPTVLSQTSDTFSNSIISAQAAIKGFNLRYDDRNWDFYRQTVEIKDVELVESNRKVKVTINLLMNDSAPVQDRKYSGHIRALVIAQVADN